MKIHRRKSALLAALIMAIGVAALPLEGAANLIRDPIYSPPQAGDPDVPNGSAFQVWLGSLRVMYLSYLAPARSHVTSRYGNLGAPLRSAQARTTKRMP